MCVSETPGWIWQDILPKKQSAAPETTAVVCIQQQVLLVLGTHFKRKIKL